MFSAQGDAGGGAPASLEKGEDVVVAEVGLGSGSPESELIPEGRWMPGYSPLMRCFSELTMKMGKARYNISPARKRPVEEAKRRGG